MLNFSKISSDSIIGKFLRFPLKLLPQNMIVPIIQGKLRGKKWIVGSSNHGCWLGSYEYEKQVLFSKIVKEGSVVYDIGAHVGFYTLLSSVLVGQKGKVISFEPLPANIQYLKKHLEINKCNNVEVIEAAVSNVSGTFPFEEGSSSSQGKLFFQGQFHVRCIIIDEMVSTGRIPPPNYMKIDIEGGEFKALLGAKQMLLQHYPTIFLATHGEEVHKNCCEFLKEIGYNLKSINGKNIYETDEILAFRKC